MTSTRFLIVISRRGEVHPRYQTLCSGLSEGLISLLIPLSIPLQHPSWTALTLAGGEARQSPAQLNSITPDGKRLDLQMEEELNRNTLTMR